MKNPDKAFALSYYFPGAGQMYAGYFWKGLVSTILNAGLIYFSVWNFANGYFFSGAFTGACAFLFILQRWGNLCCNTCQTAK